ncbi:hypothetical protein [Limimaricola sp.]|uniref:hypothetical protein n=1 Tax=Limimaricola sp. TaxID=2211665 RepID=UPI004057FC86
MASTKRRMAAKRRMGEVRALALRVVVRDPKATHVTVWLTETRRAEWWPGTGKWATRGAGKPADGRGGVDEFVAWLREQQHAA